MVEKLIQIDPAFSVFMHLTACAYGLAIGSFLNVCIHRLPSGISIVRPPSACPKCGSHLRWYDNIPVLAWLLWLGGRCRFCGGPIRARYPLIELLSGFLALGIFMKFGWSAQTLIYYGFGAAMIVATFIDIEHLIIPNEISMGGIPVGFSLAAAGLLPIGWKASLIGALVGAGIPWAVSIGYYLIRKREGMGFGDVKLLATFGAFLGWKGAMFSLFLGSALGATLAFILLFLGKTEWSARLPFGPSLAAGAMLYLFAGEFMITQYWRFTGALIPG